jgi:hypothetical protein
MLLEHYEMVQDTVSAFEIDAALKFVTTEFEELQSVLPSLLPHSITFGDPASRLPCCGTRLPELSVYLDRS